jgi:hypothetical protein
MQKTSFFFVSYSNLPIVYMIGSEDSFVMNQLAEYADGGNVVHLNGGIIFNDKQSSSFPRIEVVSLSSDVRPLTWAMLPEETASLRSSLGNYYSKTNISLNAR